LSWLRTGKVTGEKMNELKTLAGLTLQQLQKKLDEELPASAYSQAPGSSDPTEMDPGRVRKVLNGVFGLCGMGWGYTYSSSDLKYYTERRAGSNGEQGPVVATLLHLDFWYRLQACGVMQECHIHACGGSEKSRVEGAVRGAIANAVLHAVSHIGFQEPLRPGIRPCQVEKVLPDSPERSEPPSPDMETCEASLVRQSGENDLSYEGTNRSVPIPAPDEREPVRPTRILAGDYAIPAGKHAGKKLSELPLEALRWYADSLRPVNAEQEELKNKARTYLLETAG
jgi:hypothetical protein